MSFQTGNQNEKYFTLGGIGAILSSVAGLMIPFSSYWIAGVNSTSSMDLSILTMDLNSLQYGMLYLPFPLVILGIGMILSGMGFWGIWKEFKKVSTAISFAFSIIVAFLFFTIAFYLIASKQHPGYITYAITIAVTYLLLGAMQVLWGVSHITARKYAGNSLLCLATGTMFIVSGVLSTSFLFSWTGLFVYFLFSLCNFLAAIVFFNIKHHLDFQTGKTSI